MVHCGAPRCGVVYGDFGTVPIWSFSTVRCEAKYQTVARLGALSSSIPASLHLFDQDSDQAPNSLMCPDDEKVKKDSSAESHSFY